MAPKPDWKATFWRAVANGTVSVSIIRKGRILDLGRTSTTLSQFSPRTA